MSAPSICVVGSLNRDLVIRTPRLPQAGETLLGGPFATFSGGKGANQAVGAARLRASVAMLGCVGADGNGAALIAEIGESGVDVSGVAKIEGVPTGVGLITIEEGGESTIVVAEGANARLTAEDVQVDAVASAQWLIVQLETPLATVAAAIAHARAHGTLVALNAAPAAPLPAAIVEQVDLLIVNQTEAQTLAGGTAGADPEDLLARLLRLGPPTVVITLGSEGALAGNAAGTLRQAALNVESVDAVAAGDAFVAALVVALGEGQELQPALRFACAAGGLATTKAGAMPSLPTRSEVDAALV